MFLKFFLLSFTSIISILESGQYFQNESLLALPTSNIPVATHYSWISDPEWIMISPVGGL